MEWPQESTEPWSIRRFSSSRWLIAGRLALTAISAVAVCALLLLSGDAAPARAARTIQVPPGQSIQAAIDEASPGDTVELAAGTFKLTGTVTVGKESLTITGQGSDRTVVEVDSSWFNDPNKAAFLLNAPGITFQKTHVRLVGKGQGRLLDLAKNNVIVRENEFSGEYVIGDSQVSRAMVVWAGVTGIVIENNTIHGLRQPAYISGASSSRSGTISNNYVYGTKGWVVEGADLLFQGNRWGAGSNSNYLDIAILSMTPSNLYTDLVALSRENNGAVVEDQRHSPTWLTKVLVRAGASGDGTPTNPIGRISDGLAKVVPGGSVVVEPGTYPEDVAISKSSVTLVSAEGRDKTIIQGKSTGYTGAVKIDAEGVTLGQDNRGFKIVGAGQAGVYLTGAADGVTVQGNEVVSSGLPSSNALVTEGGVAHLKVIGNIFSGNAAQLVYVNGAADVNVESDDVQFTNNVFSGDSKGPTLGLSSKNSSVKDNQFTGVGHVGLSSSARGSVISGNSFTGEPGATGAYIAADKGLGLDMGAVLASNSFKRSVVVRSSGTLLPAVWGRIQPAIDSAVDGDIVSVSAGTYAESLKIERPLTLAGAGKDKTFIRPSQLLSSGIGHKYDTNMQVAMLVNNASNVTVSDMTIDGNELGANAVVFWNGSTGTLKNLKIMRPKSFDGTQTGQGLAVDAGSGKTTDLDVVDCDFEQWNKNAIDVVDGNGGTSGGGTIRVDVSGGTFTGRGTTSTIAQNGILFWERAEGTVSGSVQNASFKDINYAPNDNDAAAVLLYHVTKGTVGPIRGCSFANTELYIALADGSKDDVLATGNTFDGVSADTAAAAQLFPVEDRIVHRLDDATLGLVRVRDKNLYVTPRSGSVQRAVDAAAAGDTVNVAAGSYTETGQIVIDKDLTITGQDKSTTIIRPGADTGSSGDSRGWLLVKPGKTFNLSGVTLDGEGKNVFVGILTWGKGKISDCIIKNIKYPGYYGFGIKIQSDTAGGSPAADVTVERVTLENIGRVGVHVGNTTGFTGTSTLTATGNVYKGKGTGDWLDYAFEAGWGAHATITGNTIRDCTGVASVDKSTSAGVVVTTYFASGTQATVTNNIFINNTTGIAVGYDDKDTSTVVAHNNDFGSNVGPGVESTAPTVDATNNWWGSHTGPSHASNPGGTGVAVSDKVAFSPWLGSGSDTDAATPGFQPAATPRYGIPTRLVFVTQPGSAEEGKALSPQPVVQAQDAEGNLGINFAGTVTLSLGSNPSGGSLSGAVSQVASGGVAAFSGLSVSKAGSGYTVVASADGLASVTSASFSISSPPSGGDGGGGGGGGAAATPTPVPTPVPPVPTPEAAVPVTGGLPPQVGAPSVGRIAGPMMTTSIPAGGGASVATGNPSVSVSVLAGGVVQQVVASYQGVVPGSVPPPQGALQLGGTVFQLEFRDPATQAKVPTTAQVTVSYTEADVAAAGGDAASLAIAIFDGTSWVPLPSTVDTAARTVTATTVIDATFALVAAPPVAAGQALDYAVQDGWFFSQTNGLGGAGGIGYTVTDADGIPFWTEFQRLGGVPVVGYPVSQRFVYGGFVTQAFQKMVFQWRPESNSVAFVNVFDELSRAGRDGWLLSMRQTPQAFDTSPDTGRSFEQVMARHLEMLKQDPAIEAFFLGTEDWLNRYGLPVSYADFGDVFVVRAQRAVFQRWKVDVPWATAGEVTVANGGDLGKEAGLWPLAATAPVPASTTSAR